MDEDPISRAEHARRSNPFLNTRQTGHYLGLSPRHLERMRSRGEGPRFRRHGRYVLYHIDDIDAWSLANAGGGQDD